MKLDTSDPEEVKKFVSGLGAALAKDMAEIRETDLDRAGSYKKAHVEFSDHALDTGECDLFVDRLGRVITPYGEPWDKLVMVIFADNEEARRVVRKETRYEGDAPVSQVVYLEAKGVSNVGMD